VFESQGLPEYPPRRNTWEFPAPPVQKRWKWIAALSSVLGLAAAGAMITVLVLTDTDDFPGLIDDQQLTDTVASECELMTRTVESMPLTGSPERQAATIADQNQAVETMVDAIRASRAVEVRDDRPAEDWLSDWELLVEVRAGYARELLRDPNASLRVPLDSDGDEITERMNDVWAGSPVCEVPEVLVRPSSGSVSDV
jgi:hypothetical protein